MDMPTLKSQAAQLSASVEGQALDELLKTANANGQRHPNSALENGLSVARHLLSRSMFNLSDSQTSLDCTNAAHRLARGEFGGFAGHIGDAYLHADSRNRQTLVTAFPELFIRAGA